MAPRITVATFLLFTTGVAFAEPDKDAVNKAIKRGQAYLKFVFDPRGPGPGGQGPGGMVPNAAIMGPAGGTGAGPAALAGLALLESGVPANDGVVINISQNCRMVALSTTSTYEIALIIMLLDRLGSLADEGLIQFLTLRLLTGQTHDGSWSYSCDGLPLNPVEERQLRAELMRDAKLVTPDGAKPTPKKEKPKPREDLDDGPKSAKKDPTPAPKEEPKEEKPKGLHPALDGLARKAISGGGGIGVVPRTGTGDHSNTQFATVGLWCGRRHSVDVKDALAALDKHYRACQQPGGGWAYTAAQAAPSPAMSCAGLMGLAIGFGAKNLKDGADKEPRLEDPEALGKDPVVMAGLKYLGDFIAAANDQGLNPTDLSRNLYFMWSLERVGMVYGLNTIGKVDWYDWGASILIKTQNQNNGSWRSDGFHSGSVDNATAFALLFLSRANLASDLSNKLKGKVKDPGTSRLVRGTDLAKLLDGAGKGSAAKTPDSGTGNPTRPKVEPPPPTEVDAGGRLANTLIAATAGDRDALIAKYRDTKGGEYTEALAFAANKLTGEGQTKVREALAQRLTRMTAETLNACMRDSNRELRRAAALAVGQKGRDRFPEFADNLIRLIADDEQLVVQAARASLKALTDQDFGPEAGSSASDRGKALVAWRAWWEARKK
jgi:hypothetical protein